MITNLCQPATCLSTRIWHAQSFLRLGRLEQWSCGWAVRPSHRTVTDEPEIGGPDGCARKRDYRYARVTDQLDVALTHEVHELRDMPPSVSTVRPTSPLPH